MKQIIKQLFSQEFQGHFLAARTSTQYVIGNYYWHHRARLRAVCLSVTLCIAVFRVGVQS